MKLSKILKQKLKPNWPNGPITGPDPHCLSRPRLTVRYPSFEAKIEAEIEAKNLNDVMPIPNKF